MKDVIMRKGSVRAEQDNLRDRMRRAGMTYPEIAAEFARRYRFRRRAAFRQAHGWTLDRAADRINAMAAALDLDPEGKASMTAPRLCEMENWPYPDRRRPTPQMLAVLATVYGTDVHSLLDIDDREHIPPGDRLLIDSMRTVAGSVAGGKPGSGSTTTIQPPYVQSMAWPADRCSSLAEQLSKVRMTNVLLHVQRGGASLTARDSGVPVDAVERAAVAERADAVADELRWILGYVAKLAGRGGAYGGL